MSTGNTGAAADRMAPTAARQNTACHHRSCHCDCRDKHPEQHFGPDVEQSIQASKTHASRTSLRSILSLQAQAVRLRHSVTRPVRGWSCRLASIGKYFVVPIRRGISVALTVATCGKEELELAPNLVSKKYGDGRSDDSSQQRRAGHHPVLQRVQLPPAPESQ